MSDGNAQSMRSVRYSATLALIKKHRLGFAYNPGGGEFWLPDGRRCQIAAMDDDDDFARLLEWLRSLGLEGQECDGRCGVMGGDGNKPRVLLLTEDQLDAFAHACTRGKSDGQPPESLTCATCRWWTEYAPDPLPDAGMGYCEELAGSVEADFGCVDWEAEG